MCLMTKICYCPPLVVVATPEQGARSSNNKGRKQIHGFSELLNRTALCSLGLHWKPLTSTRHQVQGSPRISGWELTVTVNMWQTRAVQKHDEHYVEQRLHHSLRLEALLRYKAPTQLSIKLSDKCWGVNSTHWGGGRRDWQTLHCLRVKSYIL